jgi:hypothetical protein
MDILQEQCDIQSLENEVLEESTNTGSIKKYFIRGPFLESETKNGNGRIYPKSILTREVEKINELKIKNNRCMGELGHPATTEINLDRVSHLITELKMDGNLGMGKAFIVDTPMGKIAKSLIDAGIKLGVSTRGVGTLRESVVQNDFRLLTADIVSDPSAPSAWVDAVLESQKEWVMENGILTEKEIEKVLKQADRIVIENHFSVEEKSAAFLKLFKETMDFIKGKHV